MEHEHFFCGDRRCRDRRRLSLAALALALTAAPVLTGAAPRPARRAAAPSRDTRQPPKQQIGDTVITGGRVDYDTDKEQYILTGSVELVSTNSHMTAEKMTVKMTRTREVEWARCEGNVFVEKKNPEDDTVVTARCRVLEDYETEKKARLIGDVVVHQSSPRLLKPAVITGQRVEMDLRTKVNVVFRGPEAQAKAHLDPKGQEGKPTPEPVDLLADRIEMNSQTQEYDATGKPVMVRPSSRLQAKRLRFQVEGEHKDVKVAYADDDVIYDGKNEKSSVVHATGDKGVYTRENNELVLDGNVYATTQDPGDERPSVHQGEKFIYNTKTGAHSLLGGGRGPATVVLPPGKGAPRKEEKAAGTGGEAGQKKNNGKTEKSDKK